MNDASRGNQVLLGDEYDDELREVVLDVLREMGALPTSEDWTVGGSQELEARSLEVGDRVIHVEAETYVGLSISGDSSLVRDVAARVRTRLTTLESLRGLGTLADD